MDQLMKTYEEFKLRRLKKQKVIDRLMKTHEKITCGEREPAANEEIDWEKYLIENEEWEKEVCEEDESLDLFT